VESSFSHNFLKLKKIEIRKLALKDLYQTTVTLEAIHGSEKFFVYLSEHVLIESEELVVEKGLNFAVKNRVSNLDMVCVAESARFKLLLTFGMDFCLYAENFKTFYI
jgi:hypothetical protein